MNELIALEIASIFLGSWMIDDGTPWISKTGGVILFISLSSLIGQAVTGIFF